MPSFFNNLPFQITVATFIDVSSSTYDAYGHRITNTMLGTETEATTSGFFQLAVARGVSRGDLAQRDEGFLKEYDAMFYARPVSNQASGEDDIFLWDGTRYRIRNINKVYSFATAIDHYEYFLQREEGIK